MCFLNKKVENSFFEDENVANSPKNLWKSWNFRRFFQKEQIQNLPETTNFSQMWKHLTTGNILKDHVQIRVVLGFKTKR